MADPDDIEALLAQIEGSKRTATPPPASKPATKPTTKQTLARENEYDIDGLLDEIGTFTPPPQRRTNEIKKATHSTSPLSVNIPKASKPQQEESTTPSGTSKRRCQPACIGGTATPKGCTSSMIDQKSCDRLRCTNCDFKIVSFNDSMWNSTVDVLFFRNYIFDDSKLKAVLAKRPGFCAYACQCSWISVDTVTTTSYGSGLKWACGTH